MNINMQDLRRLGEIEKELYDIRLRNNLSEIQITAKTKFGEIYFLSENCWKNIKESSRTHSHYKE